jgi:hypothetical protein
VEEGYRNEGTEIEGKKRMDFNISMREIFLESTKGKERESTVAGEGGMGTWSTW